MNTSSEIDKILPAFISAQSELQNPTKDSKAGYGKFQYDYTNVTKLIDTIKPVLAKHGLGFMQIPKSKEGLLGMESFIMHESGQWISDEFYVGNNLKSLSNGNQLQELGSSITYLRRYLLQSMFGLGAEDNDGQITKPKQQSSAPGKKEMTGNEKLILTLKTNKLNTDMSDSCKEYVRTLDASKAANINSQLYGRIKDKKILSSQDAEKFILNFK